MDKKASETTEFFSYVSIRLLIMVIMVVFIKFVIFGNIFSLSLDTRGIENVIMNKRLLYSPNMLAYQDKSTGRTYPGTINLTNFNTTLIEQSFENNNRMISAKLDLKDVYTGKLYQMYINEMKAKIWENQIYLKDFEVSNERRYVLIYRNGYLDKGLLKSQVIVQ
ncbi:MAG: hypothetical protein KKF44_00170 [Nanoarchaeota archaeon]|nr:hypothetical protein [Nanoarchaeota archaeon]